MNVSAATVQKTFSFFFLSLPSSGTISMLHDLDLETHIHNIYRTTGMHQYCPDKVCYIVLACGVLHNVTQMM